MLICPSSQPIPSLPSSKIGSLSLSPRKTDLSPLSCMQSVSFSPPKNQTCLLLFFQENPIPLYLLTLSALPFMQESFNTQDKHVSPPYNQEHEHLSPSLNNRRYHHQSTHFSSRVPCTRGRQFSSQPPRDSLPFPCIYAALDNSIHTPTPVVFPRYMPRVLIAPSNRPSHGINTSHTLLVLFHLDRESPRISQHPHKCSQPHGCPRQKIQPRITQVTLNSVGASFSSFTSSNHQAKALATTTATSSSNPSQLLL